MIFHIQRYCIDDGDGIRTCVFFKGCPLRCKWCHNIESLSFDPQEEFDETLCIHCGKCKEGCLTGARQIIGEEMTAEQILQIVRRDKPFYGETGGLTVTGVDDELILKNLDVLYHLGCRIVLRCPIVPGGNLDDAFIEKIAFLRRKYPNIQVQLMPYHRTGLEKAKRLGLPAQTEYTVPDSALLTQIRKQIGMDEA